MTVLGAALRDVGVEQVLMVLAHPDDEVIFGWPLLQDRTIQRQLLIISSDLHNPGRQWCSHRKSVLQDLCHRLDVECTCLDYASGFYRQPSRNGDLRRMIKHVWNEVGRRKCHAIFTHNPMGEYGHLDHQLVHNIMTFVDRPLLVTDMFLSSDWTPFKHAGPVRKRAGYQRRLADCEIDLSFYREAERLYRQQGCWTWAQKPIRKCGLYLL